MLLINNITSNPGVMTGKACIRNTRITVSLILNLVANGLSKEQIIKEYPALTIDDIHQCLNYAAFLAEEELYQIQQ